MRSSCESSTFPMDGPRRLPVGNAFDSAGQFVHYRACAAVSERIMLLMRNQDIRGGTTEGSGITLDLPTFPTQRIGTRSTSRANCVDYRRTIKNLVQTAVPSFCDRAASFRRDRTLAPTHKALYPLCSVAALRIEI